MLRKYEEMRSSVKSIAIIRGLNRDAILNAKIPMYSVSVKVADEKETFQKLSLLSPAARYALLYSFSINISEIFQIFIRYSCIYIFLYI